jgi:hypothetical protein
VLIVILFGDARSMHLSHPSESRLRAISKIDASSPETAPLAVLPRLPTPPPGAAHGDPPCIKKHSGAEAPEFFA